MDGTNCLQILDWPGSASCFPVGVSLEYRGLRPHWIGIIHLVAKMGTLQSSCKAWLMVVLICFLDEKSAANMFFFFANNFDWQTISI